MRSFRLLPSFLLPLCALCLLWLNYSAFALEADEIEFRQALKDMSNDLRLLCVAAHPDDEDGATLAYHRYKYGIKTFALIGTRGEGGQNEIGPELYEDLAVIRTKEMMEAAKIEGAELHFLDMPDFGFSKTIEETFEKWGKDVLLEKMVRKIREIRPHVIITHHGRMKDHGHHQAIGWAVQEAFEKAADANFETKADPRYFVPGPWQVQRLYIRDFGGETTDAVSVEINERDELREKTYAEMAADALRAHKSQGMEQFIELLLSKNARAIYQPALQVNTPGDVVLGPVYGALFAGLSVDTINTYISPYPLNSMTNEEIFALTKEINRERPIVGDKVRLYSRLRQSLRYYFNLRLEVAIDDPLLTRGESANATLTFSDLGTRDVDPGEFAWEDTVGLEHYPTHSGSRQNFPHFKDSHVQITVPFLVSSTAPYDLPYDKYLREKSLRKSILNNRFWGAANIRTIATDGTSNKIYIAVGSRVDLEVAPDVVPSFDGSPYLVRQGSTTAPISMKVVNHAPEANLHNVSIIVPDGWSAEPSTIPVEFASEDEQKNVSFVASMPSGTQPGTYNLAAKINGLDFMPEATIQVANFINPSRYDALQNVGFSEPTEKDVYVGLFESYDTSLQDVMTKMGLKFDSIPPEDKRYQPERLDKFKTIIIDMRAYGKRPDLRENNAALLEWCKAGGTLIVMYHKTQDWSSDFAPYPIILSNNRVTREDAPVKMLVPEHPWFNTPNKIEPEDWDGWRQERGLYFPQQWDDAYTPLIETTDPGEHIPPGSCLIAKYGEGTYFYTSLVWYRQLRELHPGALKLFANMLAL